MISDTHDATVKAAVERELRLDPRVTETEIGVAVVNGVVTLSGTVDREAAKRAAAEAVHRVPGVRDLANDLMIRVPYALARTDTDLAEAVRDALERETGAKTDSVHSTVCNGVVTLTGEVDTLDDGERAVDAARAVAGVRRVDDRIGVRTPVVDLFVLHRAIEKALARRAEREADRIELSLHRGVVRLTGSIDSKDDRAAIVELVRHAPGVQGVEDRLRVPPTIRRALKRSYAHRSPASGLRGG
jgi:osmotically-inducible protein OsmY